MCTTEKIKLQDEFEDSIRAGLMDSLPPIFSRNEAVKHIGNLVSSRTLANLDCKIEGPRRKIKLGREIGYERSDFIDFLMSNIKVE